MKDVLVLNDKRKIYDGYNGICSVGHTENVDQTDRETYSVIAEDNYPNTDYGASATEWKLKEFIKEEGIQFVCLINKDNGNYKQIGYAFLTSDIQNYLIRMHDDTKNTTNGAYLDLFTLGGLNVRILNSNNQIYNRGINPNDNTKKQGLDPSYVNTHYLGIGPYSPVIAITVPVDVDWILSFANYQNSTYNANSGLYDWIRADGTHDGITIIRIFSDNDVTLRTSIFENRYLEGILGVYSINNESYQKVYNVCDIKRILEINQIKQINIT